MAHTVIQYLRSHAGVNQPNSRDKIQHRCSQNGINVGTKGKKRCHGPGAGGDDGDGEAYGRS